MIMNLLKVKVKKLDINILYKKLGYSSVPKAKVMIENFLQEDSLESWLENSVFDFRYTSEKFLLKLLKIFEIKDDIYWKELELAKKYNFKLNNMVKPYVYIDTKFKRTTQPIFSLAAMEQFRCIYFSKKDFINRSTEEILINIKAWVIQHCKENKGELPMWGKIYYYQVHFFGENYVFDTEGKLKDKDIIQQSSILCLN